MCDVRRALRHGRCSRIERLREKLRKGDVDLEPDEIQAAIEKATRKLGELQRIGAASGAADVRIFAKLPDAAERFRRQITAGLGGNPVESAKARLLLRATLGDIRLESGDGEAYGLVTSCAPAS
jgi:hypothetical protein